MTRDVRAFDLRRQRGAARRIRLAAHGVLHDPADAAAFLNVAALADASDGELCAAVDTLALARPYLAGIPWIDRKPA